MPRGREMVLKLDTLPPEALEWVKAQADNLGLDPSTWVRMTLVLMSKGRRTALQDRRDHEAFALSLGVAPYPARESDLDAIIDEKLAEAGDVTEQTEPPSHTADVRPLHRPPTPFSPATSPKHLAGI